MKKTVIIFGIAALALMSASCKQTKSTTKNTAAGGDATEQVTQGLIVYYDIDRVMQEFDMANEESAKVETKVNEITKDLQNRQNSLERKMKDFNNKLEKGLYTRSTAEVEGKKIQDQQSSFQKYAQQKQQEIAEEQQATLNNIMYEIKNFLDSYNEAKGYAMIIATQGSALLPTPVSVADSSLDITDEIIAGLNETYGKNKSGNKE